MLELYNMDILKFRINRKFDLLYLDPPYGPKGIDVYFGTFGDWSGYLTWMRETLTHLTFKHTDFNIVVHLDHKIVHYIKVMMDSIFGRDSFRNEIIWCYTGPSTAKSHFPRKHDTLLWYQIGKAPFEIEHIPYKTLSSASGSSWGGIDDVDSYLERGKKLEDYWLDIPALNRNQGEKVHYPTQKPVDLMLRLVRCMSRKRYTVVDPMMGSGTMGVAALRLGRRFIGNDVSYLAYETAKGRLEC